VFLHCTRSLYFVQLPIPHPTETSIKSWSIECEIRTTYIKIQSVSDTVAFLLVDQNISLRNILLWKRLPGSGSKWGPVEKSYVTVRFFAIILMAGGQKTQQIILSCMLNLHLYCSRVSKLWHAHRGRRCMTADRYVQVSTGRDTCP